MPNDSNKLTADEREELVHPTLEPTVATCVKALKYIEELERELAAHDVGEHPSEPSYETLRYRVEYWRDAASKAETGWKAYQIERDKELESATKELAVLHKRLTLALLELRCAQQFIPQAPAYVKRAISLLEGSREI